MYGHIHVYIWNQVKVKVKVSHLNMEWTRSNMVTQINGSTNTFKLIFCKFEFERYNSLYGATLWSWLSVTIGWFSILILLNSSSFPCNSRLLTICMQWPSITMKHLILFIFVNMMKRTMKRWGKWSQVEVKWLIKVEVKCQIKVWWWNKMNWVTQ